VAYVLGQDASPKAWKSQEVVAGFDRLDLEQSDDDRGQTFDASQMPSKVEFEQIDEHGSMVHSVIEFIPIKPLAAKASGAPGSYAGHNRFPLPDRGHPPSTDGCGL